MDTHKIILYGVEYLDNIYMYCDIIYIQPHTYIEILNIRLKSCNIQTHKKL